MSAPDAVTKQQGFCKFDLAAYLQRKYRGKATDQRWYLLPNLGTLQAAVSAFTARFGIAAMFKDCKIGCYNLDGS